MHFNNQHQHTIFNLFPFFSDFIFTQLMIIFIFSFSYTKIALVSDTQEQR